ncbi:hypothetical protein RB195_021432 [Necator americanus]|uniref:Uncharacterized protein n=1 Tax=Necator americanus TaxID=51031 RepID=A0ABR1EBN9_NECAM
MDLRSDLKATECVVMSVSACIDKLLDLLELIPAVVDSCENNNIPNDDVKQIESTFMEILQLLGELSRRCRSIESVIFFLKKVAFTSSKIPNQLELTNRLPSPAKRIHDESCDDNDVEGCTERPGDSSIEGIENVKDDAPATISAEIPQRGRRRARSATRIIKKVVRRFSLSRSRRPRSQDYGEHFDGDVTLSLGK